MTMFSKVYDFKIIFFWYKRGANTKNELLSNPERGKNAKTDNIVLQYSLSSLLLPL